MQGNVKILKLSLGLAWLGLAWLANSQVYFINNTIKYCHLQIILYYFKNFIKHFKFKKAPYNRQTGAQFD